MDSRSPMPANPFDLTNLSSRAADVTTGLPDNLKNDPVVLLIMNAVSKAAVDATIDVQARVSRLRNLVPTTLQTGPTAPQNPGSIDQWEMRSFAGKVRDDMFGPGSAYGRRPAQPRADPSSEGFGDYFVDYYSAYFSVGFVDRFGTKLSVPQITQTITDTEITGAVAVFVELVADYMLRTPVWVDSKGNYYPGTFASGTKPTALTEGLAQQINLIESTTPLPTGAPTGATYTQLCGITALKAQAIQYLSLQAGNRASMLGGLVGGSFGGLSIGLGVLGKLSIGDNQTLENIVKTILDRSFERAMEEASYKILYWIPYDATSILADIVQFYLASKSSAQPKPSS
jgi:hypothetical protein